VSSNSNDPYQPIDCTLHDRIEAHATLHETVRISYQDGDRVVDVNDRIVDWFVKDGAEFMQLAGGPVVRLDRVLSVSR
jgi:transcriptional antiterminator Rof (Rho-off)